MIKSILVAAAAAFTMAAPASAAVFTFNFNSVTPTSSTAATSTRGDSMTWTQTVAGETLSVRVSAFSLNTNGVMGIADLGRWTGSAGGLGITATNESGGGNSHTVDGYRGNDILVFQFSKSVQSLTAASNAYSQFSGVSPDNDMITRVASTTQAWTTGFTASQMGSGTGITFANANTDIFNNGSRSAVDINPGDHRGNLLFIAARDWDDAFKLFQLTVSTNPPVAVPEPATWAMMIAGFGLVGAGMRRRRAKGAARVIA